MARAQKLEVVRRPRPAPAAPRRAGEGALQEALFAAALLIGLALFALVFRWALGPVARLLFG